jgi:PAS domain S-box-containing protein
MDLTAPRAGRLAGPAPELLFSGGLSAPMSHAGAPTQAPPGDLRAAGGQLSAELLEAAPDAIIAIDREGKIQLVNSQASRMFGYAREALLGLPVEALIPARLMEAHQGHRDAYFLHPRARSMGAGLELLGKRKDGSEFPVDVSLTSIHTPTGTLAAAFVRDVTARKQAENALRQANEDLEAFSHTISHDLRAPLRTMRGFSRALIEDAPAGIDPTAADYLRRIDRAGVALERLVDDLLEYSRVGTREVRTRAVDAGAVVAEVLQELSAVIAAAHARVSVRRPLLHVQGEPDLLGQAIANFITNAIKYVAPGTEPAIDIFSEPSGKWVRIIVADNGIGIAVEHLGRIWKPFERLHSKSQYAGTGVGLAIVARAAERMGGRAGVESQAGQGSRFWIELRPPGGTTP